MDAEVQKYSYIAKKLAHKYAAKNRSEYDDLYQVAMIGIWQALQRTKEQGNQEAYVFIYARGNVLKHMSRNRHVIRPPRTIVELATSIRKRGLEDKNSEEIAAILNVKTKHVNDCLIYLQENVSSLDSQNEDGLTLLDQLGYTENMEYKIDYGSFINSLNKRDRFIFKKTLQGLSQSEIASELGIAQMTVSRYLKGIKQNYLNSVQGELSWTS
ncbi:sigma-70 family RNA polymerase sigma factor (plasmid) [Lysinibacillus capsici]|uniref:sigma-70 family RNA polymerase sigma factor n=1 Tax=Lysinibacillus capsici TaxID=2115968 RepID=UPI0021DAAC9C|nr:sigma-70 family RNA polymerase sigma factor [Lysinibacillus capsici]UYB50190.1 sigma-70 family RNA polymerase sigma factor [Lysinibacillus capsici]UYB50267.1 sigma-70 family RNA polymerase sigma factor [Lysinibacillus capsici]